MSLHYICITTDVPPVNLNQSQLFNSNHLLIFLNSTNPTVQSRITTQFQIDPSRQIRDIKRKSMKLDPFDQCNLAISFSSQCHHIPRVHSV
ncbi:hypothetical protein VIGAN_04293900 [Vigna angularis var. angularis]|uniref:Uncharacterized protein n=1 Tax=Vigna angularis var. angularis TaxID=157739 RepID=A0A0S3RXQ8_PHAAN|nr:hypothetical protein VIGAN_04293900 [Vigna angularis var. angularis]